MKRIFFFFLAWYFPCHIFSNTATTENDPGSLVEGCVSAITGDAYIVEDDIVIQGAEPLRLKRSYVSQKGNGHWFNFSHLIATQIRSLFEVPESNGTTLLYRYKQSRHRCEFFPLDLSNDAKGLSNTARGKISAQTNLKNQHLSLENDGNELHVHCPDGSKRTYVKMHGQKPLELKWGGKVQIVCHYMLTSEQLPSGNVIRYNWDKYNRLIKIRTTDLSGGITYASADFHYSGKIKTYDGHDEKYKDRKYVDKADFQITTSDGRTLQYEYSQEGKHKVDCRWNLRFVKSSHYPTEQINYDHKIYDNQALTHIHLPDNRFVGFTYYNTGQNDLGWVKINIGDRNHPNYGRVKDLLAPVGHDATRHAAYRFNYDTGNRVTGVIDISGFVTNYHYDPDYRLVAKNRLNGSQLYSSEKFVWGTGGNASNLQSKSFLDSSSSVLFATRYHYDERGNVLHENFFGNLSGLSSNPSLDAQGFPVSSEAYTKNYSYTNDARNLLTSSEEQNGLRIQYEYLPGTNLCVKELTYDKDRIIQRKFYGYNQYRTLNHEIIDDGSSPNGDDLSNIRTRTIKVITPYDGGSYIGMPHVIEERYWNDYPLKKTILHYTTGGKISQKDIYDESDKHCYSLTYKYNGQGQLVEETNALGQVARYSYDAVGNKVSSQDFSGLVTKMGYDYSNRLISLSEQGPDGQVHTTYHHYDGKSNRTKTVDYLGNETRYVYDPFNNLIETHLPAQKNSDGKSLLPVIKATYDAAGRKISETDANGHTTQTEYNAYHKPTQIKHPDGTEERYIYNVDDTLKTYINTEGTETHYTYDALKRPLSKAIVKGETLSSETFTYQGSLLVSHTDPEGHTTGYEYDRGGRKIAEEKAGKRTEYSYDALGRPEKIKKGDLVTVKVYDLLDRVIEEREEGPSGELFTKICNQYDAAGNVNLITRFINGQQCHEAFIYDSFNRLITKSDALGNITRVEYEEKEGILIQKTTNALGLQTIEIFDAQENLIEKMQINSMGEKVSHEQMFYDGAGSLLEQHSFIIGGKNQSFAITQWEYDSCDRLTALYEAFGSPNQRTTRYTYTSQSLLHKLIKPSGITLEHSYDPLGRKITEASSDGTISHTFRYNNNNHLVQFEDLVHKTTTIREVNAFGQVLSETLGNGLATSSEYDPQGRRISLLLPDKSSVAYTYDARFPRTVTRRIAGDTFTHHFAEYDQDGHLIQESVENNTSRVTTSYNYDRTGRRKSTQSVVYAQAILKQDPIGNVTHLTTQGKETTYAYDSLYHVASEQGLTPHSYEHDSHSSRIQKDSMPCPVDLLHQCTDQAYDPNGNPTQSGNASYTYDALGRLTSVQTPSLQASYIYDPLHRRLAKTVYAKNEKGSWILQNQAVYLYDGQNEIGELSPEGSVRQLRILGRSQKSEADSAVALELDGKLYFPFHDLFGNVAAVLSPKGKGSTIVEQTHFSAFGEETKTINTLSTPNPWRFASKRIDPETGLILFGRRYYDPSRGRWLTPDPAGFADSMNLYAFVLNNPFTHIDLYGYVADTLAWMNPKIPNENASASNFASLFNFKMPRMLMTGEEGIYNPSQLFSLDTAKSHPQKGFGFSNGVSNYPNDARANAAYFSQLTGGYSVDIAHNASNGPFGDLFEAAMGILNTTLQKPFMTEQVATIHKAWDKFFDKNPNGHYLHACHSQGTIDTKTALQLYPPERRSRISVLAIAPIVYIDRKLCRNVLHLASEGDPIVRANEPIFKRNDPNVVWLPPHPKANKLFDHSLNSFTYENHAKRFIRRFIKDDE